MTVCFLFKPGPERQVLLGFKKVGFGAGKYAGIGGKVEAGESIERAAIREVEEEVGVKIPRSALQEMGRVTFIFPARPQWDQVVSIFLAEQWEGEPRESDEMRPRWFRTGEIPYHAMWQDAQYWLPWVIEGIRFSARITFEDDNETVRDVALDPVGSEA